MRVTLSLASHFATPAIAYLRFGAALAFPAELPSHQAQASVIGLAPASAQVKRHARGTDSPLPCQGCVGHRDKDKSPLCSDLLGGQLP